MSLFVCFYEGVTIHFPFLGLYELVVSRVLELVLTFKFYLGPVGSSVVTPLEVLLVVSSGRFDCYVIYGCDRMF